jgi:hypothetical protein
MSKASHQEHAPEYFFVNTDHVYVRERMAGHHVAVRRFGGVGHEDELRSWSWLSSVCVRAQLVYLGTCAYI